MSTDPVPSESQRLEALHHRFLAILPRIQLRGRIAFCHLKCPHQKDEAMAEMVALTWKWFVRLVQRNKDAAQCSSALAAFAARAVHSGRRLNGREKSKDALSPQAQQRHRFRVSPLPGCSSLAAHILTDALRDNTVASPDQQACFRIDFKSWTCNLCYRDQRILVDMAVGERTQHLARKYGISAARVSQKRREFCEQWNRFWNGSHDS
jgi:hypothetical protein